MKGGGVFRGMATKARQLFKRKPVTRSYPDPVQMPHTSPSRPRFRAIQLDNVRNKLPSCDPGTIRYHDRLVAHFGCQRAEAYGRDIQAGDLHLLPTEEDFRNTMPFGWVRPQL